MCALTGTYVLLCFPQCYAISTIRSTRPPVVVFFTLTNRASTIPSNIRGCQSGTWSQRGTKVNQSHHGDNQLLRPTVIQIATKSMRLQAMAPANIKTVCQASLLHIESSLDLLGLLSPTHHQRSQQQSGRITNYAPTSFDQQVEVFQSYTSYKYKEN